MLLPEVVQGLEAPLLGVVHVIAPPPLDVSTCPFEPVAPFAIKPLVTFIVPPTSSV